MSFSTAGSLASLPPISSSTRDGWPPRSSGVIASRPADPMRFPNNRSDDKPPHFKAATAPSTPQFVSHKSKMDKVQFPDEGCCCASLSCVRCLWTRAWVKLTTPSAPMSFPATRNSFSVRNDVAPTLLLPSPLLKRPARTARAFDNTITPFCVIRFRDRSRVTRPVHPPPLAASINALTSSSSMAQSTKDRAESTEHPPTPNVGALSSDPTAVQPARPRELEFITSSSRQRFALSSFLVVPACSSCTFEGASSRDARA
mmetsp:Transcript_34465/g.75435  ORF Transcript_34465/g.75435 Transcript_34465/m.75435 type:complete len:258 (+) Transcript_34465:320-1093(+)